MATTTMNDRERVTNRSTYWMIAAAVVVVLGIL